MCAHQQKVTDCVAELAGRAEYRVQQIIQRNYHSNSDMMEDARQLLLNVRELCHRLEQIMDEEAFGPPKSRQRN